MTGAHARRAPATGSPAPRSDNWSCTLPLLYSRLPSCAGMAELADAPGSKSGEVHPSCGFDPRSRHHSQRAARGARRASPVSAGSTPAARASSPPHRVDRGEADRRAGPIPERLYARERPGWIHTLRDHLLAAVGEHLDGRPVEEHAQGEPAIAPACRRSVPSRVSRVERPTSRLRPVNEHLEGAGGDADRHLFAVVVRQREPLLFPRTRHDVIRNSADPGSGCVPVTVETGPPLSASSSRTGCCTSRMPSGRRASDSTRGTASTPRHGEVGSSFA